MAGTMLVLAMMLTIRLLVWLSLLAVHFFLARHFGQHVKRVSWSFLHGFTAEFFAPGDSSEVEDSN